MPIRSPEPDRLHPPRRTRYLSNMKDDYRHAFIEFALAQGVLRFGAFTLKSGRRSPYFFDAGLFGTGAALAELGRFYARAMVAEGIACDMLFGPAYKGIPLVAAAAVALADHHGRDLPWCFNRKEVKTYGEGGRTVGAPLAGRVLILDDVISAGLSVNEAVEIIRAAGAQPAAVLVALDRQERAADGTEPAAAAIRRRHGIPVHAIADLTTLVAYLERHGDPATLEAIRDYQAAYGAA